MEEFAEYIIEFPCLNMFSYYAAVLGVHIILCGMYYWFGHPWKKIMREKIVNLFFKGSGSANDRNVDIIDMETRKRNAIFEGQKPDLTIKK